MPIPFVIAAAIGGAAGAVVTNRVMSRRRKPKFAVWEDYETVEGEDGTTYVVLDEYPARKLKNGNIRPARGHEEGNMLGMRVIPLEYMEDYDPEETDAVNGIIHLFTDE